MRKLWHRGLTPIDTSGQALSSITRSLNGTHHLNQTRDRTLTACYRREVISVSRSTEGGGLPRGAGCALPGGARLGVADRVSGLALRHRVAIGAPRGRPPPVTFFSPPEAVPGSRAAPWLPEAFGLLYSSGP